MFARKVIHAMGKPEITENEIKNEKRVIEKLQQNGGHRNIISVLDHGWLIDGLFYYIDMRLCAMTLRDLIKSNIRSTLGARFMDIRCFAISDYASVGRGISCGLGGRYMDSITPYFNLRLLTICVVFGPLNVSE